MPIAYGSTMTANMSILEPQTVCLSNAQYAPSFTRSPCIIVETKCKTHLFGF